MYYSSEDCVSDLARLDEIVISYPGELWEDLSKKRNHIIIGYYYEENRRDHYKEYKLAGKGMREWGELIKPATGYELPTDFFLLSSKRDEQREDTRSTKPIMTKELKII